MAKKQQKAKKPTNERWLEVKKFLKSEQFAKLCGAVIMLFSVFLFIAIISLFVTSFVASKNWLGNLGFGLSRFFVESFFGIGSLGLVFLLFLFGLLLWKVRILPVWKTVLRTIFWMVWLSTLLGYIGGRWVKNSLFDYYAGVVGLTIAEGMYRAVKGFSLVILAFLAVVFLVFVHKVKIKLPKIKLPKREPKSVEAVAAMSKPREVKVIQPHAEESAKAQQHHEPEKTAVEDLPFTINDADAEDDKKATATAQPKEESQKISFNIDDEFERVNRKARGNQPKGEVAFNINEQAEPNKPAEEGEHEVTTVDENGEPLSDDDYRKHYGLDCPYDPHLDLKDFVMPGTDLLKDWEATNSKVSKDELVANKDKIVTTLRDYGIEIVEISASPGPTVTLYEIKPAPGIRISKIKNLEDDIALSLSALGIRIIAPIPGRGTIGIEVPNTKPQVVAMRTMIMSEAFQKNTKFQLPVALGKTISNEPYIADLAKMPHLLMAGATGTGKSVGLNAVIASLLYKKHPSELKFVMVDPKKVELSLYSKIERHYLAKMPDSEEAIITDVKKVVRTLNSLCIEMDQRYDLLKLAQVRKITEYNAKFCKRMLNPENGHRYLPYIVLVIDEFADLIMTAGKEVEMPIARLAQLARAVGIHLIIATQRPTTNIITGTIKANFPARIAFRVTSGIDSRTILDAGGANQLIGRGDMLISLAGAEMVRLQCALIETEEIEKIAEFIGQQRGYPDGYLLPEYLDENEEPNKDFDPKQKDELFNDAARLVVSSQFGSTSLLQRKLSLGYNRAGRIIDQLEAAGIVGPYAGSKAREVLIKDEVELEDLLKRL